MTSQELNVFEDEEEEEEEEEEKKDEVIIFSMATIMQLAG